MALPPQLGQEWDSGFSEMRISNVEPQKFFNIGGLGNMVQGISNFTKKRISNVEQGMSNRRSFLTSGA